MSTTESIDKLLTDIHKEFRASMNGVISQSMRTKGLRYKVIFGIELTRLQDLAEAYKNSTASNTRLLLAESLLLENVRESRLLAYMIMPAEEISASEADTMLEKMQNSEEVQVSVLHLFCRTSFASAKAFQWMASENELTSLAGFMLTGNLLSSGAQFTPRDEAEFLDHSRAALGSQNLLIRKAAYNATLKFMEQGLRQERQGDKLLKEAGL